MTNVADLKLCKELHELSGWDDCSESYRSSTKWKQPAYDAGYLLRKLPDSILSKVDGKYNLRVVPVASTKEPRKPEHYEADIPENALCKLSIELFKQGVLKREEQA